MLWVFVLFGMVHYQSSYCLPRPQGQDCPNPYGESYEGSWVYWDTEYGGRTEYYQDADHITSHGLLPERVNGMKRILRRRRYQVVFLLCEKLTIVI